MGRARDEFYKKLKDDYKESGSDSAIYQYISKEHTRLVQKAVNDSNRSTDSVKKSSMLQIKYHWELLLLDKETPEQYISHLLHILMKRPVLYQDTSFSTSVNFLVDFISTGLALSSTTRNILSQSKVKRKIHDKLIELVELIDSKDKTIQNDIWLRFQQGGYTIKPYVELSNITKIIINRSTNVEIKAFFYDAGYPLTDLQARTSNNTTKESLVKHSKIYKRNTREKTDKILSLMDVYCEQQSCSLFSNNLYPSNEDCEKLFSLLVHGENHEVFVPLRVDVKSGCALYIIGRKYFECLYFGKTDLISDKFKNNPAACSYAILEFHDPFHDTSISKKTVPNCYFDHSVGYMLKNDFAVYNYFYEAEDDYNDACKEIINNLEEKNNLTLLGDCPSAFLLPGKTSNLVITMDDIHKTKYEDAKESEDFLKNMDMDNLFFHK